LPYLTHTQDKSSIDVDSWATLKVILGGQKVSYFRIISKSYWTGEI